MILATGGLEFGSDLDEIEIGLLREPQGHLDLHDADLLSGGPHEADLGDADTVVCTGIADACSPLLKLFRSTGGGCRPATRGEIHAGVARNRTVLFTAAPCLLPRLATAAEAECNDPVTLMKRYARVGESPLSYRG